METPISITIEIASTSEPENDQTENSAVSEPDILVDNSFAAETDDESTYFDSFNTQDYLSPLYEENTPAFDDEEAD